MRLKTASEIVKFAGELEEKSANFYEKMAERFPERKDIFLSFAKENRKCKKMVQRAYSEVVSDALETGFSFEGMESGKYLIETNFSQNENVRLLLNKALEMEKKIQKFYLDAAEKSKSLLADVPRVFERIGEKREERKHKIKDLQEVV